MSPKQVIAAHACQLSQLGYDVAYVALYGSQNYGLADSHSDIDSKAIVMPQLTHFLEGQRVKPNVHPTLGGQIDIKDIRDMFANYLKSNINFLETLYTDTYFAARPFDGLPCVLRQNRHRIAHFSPRSIMKAAGGMAKEKCGKLYNFREGTPERDREQGYVVKELLHLRRLYYFLEDFALGYPFHECLTPVGSDRTRLLFDIKNYSISQREADRLAAITVAEVDFILNSAAIMKEPDNHETSAWLWEICDYYVKEQGMRIFSNKGE